MPTRRRGRLAPSTQRLYDNLAKRTKLSPRARIGLELYARGDVKTLKEAAEVAGCSYNTLIFNKMTPAGQAAMAEAQDIIRDRTLSTSKLLEKLSRLAVEEIGKIMVSGEKEENRLRAAVDLADRGSETSKVHRAQITGLTLSSEDAKEIASAMVEAARLRAKFAEAAEGNFDRVNTEDKVNEELSALGDGSNSERGDILTGPVHS